MGKISEKKMSAKQYDAIVIGAGQGGGPLSTTLGRAGQKVAIIEKEFPGGSCVNYGCSPTKTMVASARAAHIARRAADYGVNFLGPVTVDMKKVRERKRAIVEMFRGGSQRGLERGENVDLIFGEASFTGPKTIKVKLNDGGEQELTAGTIYINTGTRPAIPPIDGLDSVDYLTNRNIMELDTVPKHLLVLGGGYIGLEFGQMFRRFGAEVTIIEASDKFIAREDRDVADEVEKILREDGIELLLGAKATRVAQSSGKIQITIQNGDGEKTLEGSHLLVGAGRKPNTDMLNLEAAGIESERGFIKVNDKLETSAEGVYALGDVKGGPAFTHISYDDFRLLRENLTNGGNRTIKNRLVPYTVFIDPQLARVGLSEEQARAEGRNIRVAKMPMTHVARALETDETRGLMKAVVDADTNQILGATVLGIEGGEVMTVLQMAMIGKVPYTEIKDGVFAHPLLSESLNNLFMSMDR